MSPMFRANAVPSGHAAAALPSAASNSRRPMVTVIRPSRARCVEGRIPRHERAVLTARHPAWAKRLDFKRLIFGRAVGRVHINARIGRMSALGANRYAGMAGMRDPQRQFCLTHAPSSAAKATSARLIGADGTQEVNLAESGP